MPKTDSHIEHAVEIAKFKKRFEQDLRDFLVAKEEKIGDRGQWKIKNIRIRLDNAEKWNSTIEFSNASEQSFLSFTLHELPRQLTAEERLSLRQSLSSTCEAYGILPFKPRATPLDSTVLTELRAGDEKATNTWYGKHLARFIHQADKALLQSKRHTILEGGDLVNSLFSTGHATIGDAVSLGTIPKRIYFIAHRKIRGTKAESDSSKVEKVLTERSLSHHSSDEENGVTPQMIGTLIMETHRLSTGRKREVLDVLLRHHEEQIQLLARDPTAKYYLLTLREIGERLNPTNINKHPGKEYVRHLIHGFMNRPGIIDMMQEAAKNLAESNPDYLPLVAYTSRLNNDRQASRGYSI